MSCEQRRNNCKAHKYISAVSGCGQCTNCKARLVLTLHQMYLINVRTRVASWNVQRRYREVRELHQQVGNAQHVCQLLLLYLQFQ